MKPATTFVARLCLCVLLSGCQLNDGRNSSADIDGLRSVVELDTDPVSIRWEIFGTPEYSGGVPGPTDFITLIAEVPDLDPAAFETRARSEVVWIAPESTRPWISEDFKQILRKHRNTSVDLLSMQNCRAAHGKLKKTGQPVEGFICNDPSKAMIYLTLAEPSHP